MNQFSKRKNLILILCLCFLHCSFHCASEELKLSVRLEKLDLWYNLMPGGPGSFHLAGEMKVKNEESSEIKNLVISDISIFLADTKLYSFTPTFSIINGITENVSLKLNEERIFSFSTKEGLRINKAAGDSTSVDIFITLKAENGKFHVYQIQQVNIQKVY